MEPTGRRVRALVVHDGALPALDVAGPWWRDLEPVVAELDRRLGIPTAVLRLITARGSRMRGGEVTYLVEAGPPGLGSGVGRPGRSRCPRSPRAPDVLGRARRSGTVLGWATAELRALDRPLTGPPVQAAFGPRGLEQHEAVAVPAGRCFSVRPTHPSSTSRLP